MKFDQQIQKLIQYAVVSADKPLTWQKLSKKVTKTDGNLFTKHEVVDYVSKLSANQKTTIPEWFSSVLTMKPTRSSSGVAPLTIFTKPYPCSGSCIYCPDIKDVPKSYLPDEPATQRAIMQGYDTYKQIRRRIESFETNSHSTDKIELIISGGTWDDYTVEYRVWFIAECFRALTNSVSEPFRTSDLVIDNGSISTASFNELFIRYQIAHLQKLNETSKHRCVGLSIETRPDKVDIEAIKQYRRLGVTKVQLGIQSLNDDVLKANCRGHNVQRALDAVNLLKLNGFKILAHWMPNLYTSNPVLDYIDYLKMFSDRTGVDPDEIKIYPCSVIKQSQLYNYFKKGLFKPYTEEELVELLIKCKSITPRYCRISRLIRDIPSGNIVSGNKKTNLREIILAEMKKRSLKCSCIRCREIRDSFDQQDNSRSVVERITYKTVYGHEEFISVMTETDKILGFVRLSLPDSDLKAGSKSRLVPRDIAMIRELHVYGQSTQLGASMTGSSQHKGIGKKLLELAEKQAMNKHYRGIAVISAVGTREYYRKLGYKGSGKYGYLFKYFSS